MSKKLMVLLIITAIIILGLGFYTNYRIQKIKA